MRETLQFNELYHQQFVKAITTAGSSSLDEFAGIREAFKPYILALIAYHISRYELESYILDANAAEDWQRVLIHHMTNGLPRDRLEALRNCGLSVITFNFDRSFQHAILIRLSEVLGISRQEAGDAMAQWPIVHVHGSLGTLPELTADAGREYGPVLGGSDLRAASDRIKLLNDAATDSPEFEQARELIRSADVVLFLGFGYHKLNCERLMPKEWLPSRPKLFGTSMGMPQGAIVKASRRFEAQGVTLGMRSTNCVGLLNELEYEFSD